ncbi:MAG: hypothetical protein Q7S12_01485 [bacterium]|nr:hypothetical protein [bacterium]
MQISLEVTCKKIGFWLSWSAVILILVITVLWVLGVLTARGDSGAGMILFFVLSLMGTHFYLWLIPMFFIGIGMAKDARAEKNLVFSFIRWLAAGLAVYMVAIGILLKSLL